MKKSQLLKVREKGRTLYYSPLPAPRASGVCAVLVGYRRNGVDHWY
jgi:hypothetical protein